FISTRHLTDIDYTSVDNAKEIKSPNLGKSSLSKLEKINVKQKYFPYHISYTKIFNKDTSKEEASKLLKHLLPPLMALLVALYPISYTPASLAIDTARGAALFRRSCIGCHDAGGNLIQPGATLFTKDLQRNGVESEEELYSITYNGKGRMPGFGLNCMPRGQCTFGPRLQDEEIRLLAQFVKLQADKGWPNIDIYND
ncbi:cytochrome c6, chloroplastic, partial [Chenopodium quinoa]|uniref:cytochrome c6, chloroplastic n=1 Tax=Chenopodium quinoa TaxID=63459 RepID=UPI000B77C84F